MLTLKSTMSRIGFAYLALMFITFIGQTLAFILFPTAVAQDWGIWVLSYVPLYFIAFPIFCLMMKKWIPNQPGVLENKKISSKEIFCWVIVMLGMTYLFNFLTSIVLELIASMRATEVTNPIGTVISSSGLLYNVLFACLVAPIMEEIIFRKMLFDKLGGFGTKFYMIFGGLIFGLFHANFNQFFYAAILGMLFCYLYVRTGSIKLTMGLHVGINTVGSILAPLALASGNALLILGIGLWVWVMIIAGIVLFVKMSRKMEFSAGTIVLPEHPNKEGIFSAGMLIYIVSLTAMMILTLLS